jgi:hypothetical protein
MTALELLSALAEFVRKHVKDIILETRGKETGGEGREPDGERAAYVYTARLPDEDAALDNIPYILIQALTATDTQEDGEYPGAACDVRIVAVTYGADYGKGARDVMNVIERLRIALLREQVIDRRFQLSMPLERAYYPGDTAPYFGGEMITKWILPQVQREVIF